MRIQAIFVSLVSLIILHSVPAGAQPADQPLQLVVPFALGGTTDSFARVTADLLSQELGRQVVVINRAGGGGAIAVDFVAQQKPDGSTLLAFPDQATVLEPQRREKLELIGSVAEQQYAAFVRSSDPIRRLRDFAAAAKAAEKTILALDPTGKSIARKLSLVIDTPVKIQIVDAPNRPLTSLIDSTKFDMLVAPVSPGILGVPDIVAIAGFGEKPPPLRPELRTARSEGYEINISVAYGFASPKGLSREMFSRLEEALKKISTRADFISRLRSATGLDPVFQSGQELGRRTSMAHNDYCENCKKGNYCPIHEDCKKECPDCK